jgi:hypothetical protein
MKILEALTKFAGVVLLGWIGWSPQSGGVKITNYTPLSLASAAPQFALGFFYLGLASLLRGICGWLHCLSKQPSNQRTQRGVALLLCMGLGLGE